MLKDDEYNSMKHRPLSSFSRTEIRAMIDYCYYKAMTSTEPDTNSWFIEVLVYQNEYMMQFEK